MGTLRQVDGILPVEQPFDKALQLLLPHSAEMPKILRRWFHRYRGQPERLARLLISGQFVPKPLDQHTEQFVDFVQAVEHGQLAAPKALHDLHGLGHFRRRDVAQKPRSHLMIGHRACVLLRSFSWPPCRYPLPSGTPQALAAARPGLCRACRMIESAGTRHPGDCDGVSRLRVAPAEAGAAG